MPLPNQSLDNKRFPELFQESVVRIPAYAPEWTDHNLPDPGITLIELFAWLTDAQLYRLNRIGERHLRKFLKLAGVPRLLPARAAEVQLVFKPKDPETPITVPEGTAAYVPGSAEAEPVVFSTKRTLTVVGAELVKILSLKKGTGVFIDNTQANSSSHVYYLPFGSDPEVGDEMYLGFDRNLANNEISLHVLLAGDPPVWPEEPGTNPCSARMAWESSAPGEWSSLAVEDETGCLTRSGALRLTVPSNMVTASVDRVEAFWIRVRIEGAVEAPLTRPGELDVLYETPPRIDRISPNTVVAVHRSDPREESVPGDGLPHQIVYLNGAPVLDGTLLVGVGTETWARVEDLDASGPSDHHYVADLVEGQIRFGNGEHGAIPPANIPIRIQYAIGGGSSGNVKERTITGLSSEFAGTLQLANERAATGGTDAETIAQAVVRIRRDIRGVNRAVTTEDFEALALKTPAVAVARAKALPRYHPIHHGEIPGIVSVIVVPQSVAARPRPGIGFLRAVYHHLQRHRLLGMEIFVLPPDYVEVSVQATVVRKAHFDDDIVRENVTARLREFLHPLHGGVGGGGWPFGRPAYRSEVYQVIDGVDGVDYVSVVLLGATLVAGVSNSEPGIPTRTGADGLRPFDVAIPGRALVCPGQIEVVVQRPADNGHE